MKIAIDMGHTPASPGASGYIDELSEDRKFGPKLTAELERRGHTVVQITPPDWMAYPQEINQRVANANASGADLLVSLHYNAGGGTGTEVLHYPGDARGKEIAARISANLASLFGLPNRGAKARDNVGVIVNTNMTAVLVETCFVDSAADKAAYDATSWDDIVKAVADGIEGASSTSPTNPKPSKPPVSQKPGNDVTVRYAFRVKNGAWLDEVVDFNNSDSEGFAGIPNGEHDYLYIKVDHGSVKYQVHTREAGWLPWVYAGDKNDLVNGCAGNEGQAIDGVRIYYETPHGEPFKQAWYRSQTVARAGWLPVCCDDGTAIAGYDGWAGNYGEPMDRLQIKISDTNPF